MMNARITWYCLLVLILNVGSSFPQDVTQSSYSRATDELENRLEKELVDRLEKRMSIIFMENMIPLHNRLNTIEDSVSVIGDDFNKLESLFEQKLSDQMDKCSKHTKESFSKLEEDLAKVKETHMFVLGKTKSMDNTSALLHEGSIMAVPTTNITHRSTTPISTINTAINGSVLFTAAEQGNMTVVKEALASGTDVNWRKWYGASALDAAATMNQNAVAEVLIAAGADTNGQDSDGETPLYWASYAGSTAVVRTLIAFGADPNIPSNFGTTPLHHAAKEKFLDILYQLLKAGANPRAQNMMGMTPADYARNGGHNDLATMIDNYSHPVPAG